MPSQSSRSRRPLGAKKKPTKGTTKRSGRQTRTSRTRTTTRSEKTPATPTEPTPQELTRQLLDVSVTERGQFRTCRRRWDLQTIRNLTSKRPTIELDFGTGMHAALEAYYLGAGEGELDISAGHEALDTWHEGMVAKLDDGDQPPEVYEELVDHLELGHGMLDNYVAYDRVAKVQLGDVLAVEGQPVGEPLDWKQPKGYDDPRTAVTLHESGRLLVPIVDPVTKLPLDTRVGKVEGGGIPCLSARIDLLTQRRTPKKGLWVIDHKTAGSQPSDRGWDFDDQATGYCYTVWRWTGIIPRGVVPNYLIKQLPKPPRIVGKHKDKLSTAKDQLTTPDMYREALKEHGLIMPGSGRIASDDHEACMAALLERGWDPFFRRFEPMRNIDELLAFERRLFEEWHDMREARENPAKLYPNLSTWWCPGCGVRSICHAMEDGSDFEDIIEHDFVVGEDRKAAR